MEVPDPPGGPGEWFAAAVALGLGIIVGPEFSKALKPVVWDLTVSGISMLWGAITGPEPTLAIAGSMYLLVAAMIVISLPLGTVGIAFLVYRALLEE